MAPTLVEKPTQLRLVKSMSTNSARIYQRVKPATHQVTRNLTECVQCEEQKQRGLARTLSKLKSFTDKMPFWRQKSHPKSDDDGSDTENDDEFGNGEKLVYIGQDEDGNDLFQSASEDASYDEDYFDNLGLPDYELEEYDEFDEEAYERELQEQLEEEQEMELAMEMEMMQIEIEDQQAALEIEEVEAIMAMEEEFDPNLENVLDITFDPNYEDGMLNDDFQFFDQGHAGEEDEKCDQDGNQEDLENNDEEFGQKSDDSEGGFGDNGNSVAIFEFDGAEGEEDEFGDDDEDELEYDEDYGDYGNFMEFMEDEDAFEDDDFFNNSNGEDNFID